MRLSSWLRSPRSRQRTPSTRLRVGRLEDRTVPATFTVQNLADSGVGSLRAAITAANANPGADVDLVGPGPAYERWRKTPAYQQWLKDSGQAKN